MITFGNEPHMHQKAAILEVLTDFVEKINMPIAVYNPHGRAPGTAVPNHFCLNFWSSIDFHLGRMCYGRVFGLTLGDNAEDGVGPSQIPEAVHIRSTENKIVAEYNKDEPYCLHILFDLPHCRCISTVKIVLAKILDDYYRKVFARDMFINKLADRMDDRTIMAAKKALASLDRGFDNPARARKYIQELESEIGQLHEQAARDFEQLAKEASVSVDEEVISITNGENKIVFNAARCGYEVSVAGNQIPFADICPQAKVFIAKHLAACRFYPAYKILDNWLKVRAKGEVQ